MKKYIKHMVAALALVVSLVSVAHAQASAQFAIQSGSYPSDLPLVMVQRCPSGGGCNSSPSAYSTSISGVQPGDSVWVMLYYRNVGSDTAANARFTLSPSSTGSVSSQTFSSALSADNASSVSGSATVNLNQAETLTYVSTRLYGHNEVPLSLPNGQTGSELFNGGLNIGSVGTSNSCPNSDVFCNQGVVVVTYTVGSYTPPVQQPCQITQFQANPSSVTSGGSSTISWNTSNCVSANISGGVVYASSLNGTQPTGTLTNTTNYTITALGSNGSPVTQTIQVYVNPVIIPPVYQNCYISYFTANPTWVTYGGTASLTWSTTGCTSVTLSGPNIYNSNQNLNGSTSTGAIYGTQTYTLYAYGTNGGQQQQTVTISANQNNNTYCSIGSFYAAPSTVTAGNTTTLYWTTNGATSVNISGLNNYFGSQSLSGSASTGAIYGTQTYTLNAYCQNGQSQTQSITVSANQVVQNQTLQVYTGIPTVVTQTSARLTGVLTQSGGYNTQVYFQWGSSSNLGSSTIQQSGGSSSGTSFYDTITGLSAGTTYYYRAVATNSLGTVYGDTQSFSTPTITVVTPPQVVTIVRGTGSGSDLVSLQINNNQPINVCVGNIVNYIITYKNISGHELDNAVLQVLLPQDVQFQSANPGVYNASDHTITLSIGTLAADQTGTVYVSGSVLRSAADRNLIVTSATLAFTNSTNNSQESATAYGLGNTNQCSTNSLAGLALFGSGFWPDTLIGWLILILVLLLLIYLATVLYRGSTRRTAPQGGMYGPTSNGNGGMKNAAGQPLHYEDMDIPTYGNGTH